MNREHSNFTQEPEKRLETLMEVEETDDECCSEGCDFCDSCCCKHCECPSTSEEITEAIKKLEESVIENVGEWIKNDSYREIARRFHSLADRMDRLREDLEEINLKRKN